MTLTYIYAESQAKLGPISMFAEPHSYDLCERHASRLTVPHGWTFVKEEQSADAFLAGPSEDDLMAIADAVREAAAMAPEETPLHIPQVPIGRRGHLRAVPD
jgi:hypothetical protein